MTNEANALVEPVAANFRYRKKPVVIEAYCYNQKPENCRPDWFQSAVSANRIITFTDHAEIVTLEGVMTASLGDWVIKGVQGELYPCKPDIFAATYEAVVDHETGNMSDKELVERLEGELFWRTSAGHFIALKRVPLKELRQADPALRGVPMIYAVWPTPRGESHD